MQSDNSNMEDEVEALIRTLNEEAGYVAAFTLDDPDPVFASIKNVIPFLPRGRGINWDKAYSCSGPTPDEPPETLSQTIARILCDFRTYCDVAGLIDKDHVWFVSDDYFSCGIECEVRVAPQLLAAWLPLPHGIDVCAENLRACLHITFARCSCIFKNQAEQTRTV